MQIHELRVAKKNAKKRIGRGGKRGTYSGKGMKGQKARSGASIDPLFEGGRSSLVDHLKKVRGFKSIHPKKTVLGLDVLQKHFENGETVSFETLVAKRLVKESLIRNGVKIVLNGSLEKNLTFAAEIGISQSAKTIIEKAGGSLIAPKEFDSKEV